MSSSSGRRKHSACMLRIRESCPFRKLRKNKCSVSSSSEAAGRRWGNSQASVSAVAKCAETFPQTLSVQAFFHQQQQQQGGHTDMEAEAAPCIADPAFSSLSASAYSAPSASNLMKLHQNSLSTSDPSMELDSGVDPETGERAQG
ncbi:hypothetical protein MHYP_G00022540 [Metynnis hypsauchen]